ncbi:MAG: zinc-ribbon domain-containing protein [Clostridia bacterium]|nr:zinc-ribbon domain-containing protein [Clostridia bacterium]
MICSKCGYVALDGDVFCIKCGNPLNKPEPARPESVHFEEAPVPEAEVDYAEPEAEETPAPVFAPAEAEEAIDSAEKAVEAAAEESSFDAAEPVKEAFEPEEPAPVEEIKRDLFAVKAPKPEEPASAPAPVPEPETEAVKQVAEETVPVSDPEPVFYSDPDAQDNDEYEEEEEEEKPAPKKAPKRITTRIERPLSVWGFIWRTILFSIPVVNIIPLFIFAVAPGVNKNSKNYASALLILLLIGMIVLVVLGFLIFTSTDSTVLHDFIFKYFKISI